jgi:hypothetical protein
MMDKRTSAGLIWAAVGLAVASPTAWGQVVERRAKKSGPNGGTIERSIRTERGQGYIDRQIDIKRPGGATLSRDTRILTGPGGRPMGGPAPGMARFAPPPGPPRFAPRPSFSSALIAAPFLSFSFNSPPPPPPPPPVVFVPEPVYAYPAPPTVIVAPQPRYVEVPAPEPPPQQVAVADPMADAIGRLRSFHANSRRDGSLTLGHLGDDRAVPALMDRLERDGDRDVRVAAAWALGEIGDTRSAVALERAALYDKKHEVREAANIAYRRLPKPGQAQDPATIQTQGQVLDPGPAPSTVPNRPLGLPSSGEGFPQGPALEAPEGSANPGIPS